MELLTEFYSENLKARNQFGHLGIDAGRTMLP
jgi:hypothetical protein